MLGHLLTPVENKTWKVDFVVFPVTADRSSSVFLVAACTAALEIEGVPARSSWRSVLIGNPRDPASPYENGFMEPKYAEEVIVHPNYHLTIGSLGKMDGLAILGT